MTLHQHSFSLLLHRHEEAEELYSLALSSTFDGGSYGLLLPLTELGVKLNQQARHSPCHHILTPSKTALNQGFTDGLDSQSTGTGPDLEDFCQNRARSRELVIDSLGYIPLRDEVSQVFNTIPPVFKKGKPIMNMMCRYVEYLMREQYF